MTKEQIAVKEASARYSVSVANAQGVPPGYKQTEMGVIPDEWEIKTLGQIVNFTNGKAHESEIKDDGKYIVVNSKFISSEGEVRKYSDRCYCPTSIGDILMVMSDVPNGKAIAKCFIVDHEDKYTVNQRICSLRVNGADSKYVFYKLNRNPFYLASDDGVKQTNLRKDEILSCPLSIPKSQEEQRAVVAALSDVDTLIAVLDKLIAKKRAVKTAAMQQLLPGKQRLPGFSGEWEVKRFDEVADIDPDNLASNTSSDYEFRYISLEDVNEGRLVSFSEQIFQFAPPRARRKLRKGDILVSTVRPNLKSHLLFERDESDWVCSTGFSVVRCKEGKASPGYVFFQLFDGSVPRQIDTLLTGSNYPAINGSDVRALQISVPLIEEQKAIATVLSDMDNEIAALEARRDKTKAIKQGMMQELLTGRIRLV